MRVNKQKYKARPLLSQYSDDDNQFLDQFLKPSHKVQQSSQKCQNQSTVKLHHNSVPSKMPRKYMESHLMQEQNEVNRQIKQILRVIKKEEEIRRQRTRQFLEKVAAEKEEQKRVHQFKIAERRIKKRLMLIERKEKLEQELLSLANEKLDDTEPVRLKQKAKSVDDVPRQAQKSVPRNVTPIIAPSKALHIRRQAYTQPKRRQFIKQHFTTQHLQPSSQHHFLPEIGSGSAVELKPSRTKRISTITLTKDLKVQEKPKQSKYKNYLAQLRSNKDRNYTQSSCELQRLYEGGEVSREKTERAVQLMRKIQNKRRLKLRNPNEMDYKHAQKKLQLLDFLQKQQ